MTFSAQTKRELCRVTPDSVCCSLAELSGIICASGSILYRGHGEKRLSIETENNVLARRIFSLFKTVFEVTPELTTKRHARLGGRNSYHLVLEDQESRFVLEGCGIDMTRRSVPKEVTARKCCKASFMRGVFLASGSVTDPDKEYHLEIVLNDEGFAEAFARLLGKFDLPVHQTSRRNMVLLYMKGQEAITDMLSLMGAQKSRFKMDETIIRKELRNQANRAVNCDSANLQRTLNASEKQREAIESLLSEPSGRSGLTPELLQVAELRLRYPELSLEELGKLCAPPVGKSGIYHRLKKIEILAEENRNRQE